MTYTFELSNIMKALKGGDVNRFYDFYKASIEEVYFHCALMTNDAAETKKLVIKVYRTLYIRLSRLERVEETVEWYNAVLFDVLNGWCESHCISILVDEENGKYKRTPVTEAYPQDAVSTMFTESETANLAATYINILNPVLAMTSLAYYFDNFQLDVIARYLKVDDTVVLERTKYSLGLIEKKCIDYAWDNKVEIKRVDVHVILLSYMALAKVTTCPDKDNLYAEVCDAISK